MKLLCLCSLLVGFVPLTWATPLLQAIDLTHQTGNNITVTWPNNKAFEFNIIHKGVLQGVIPVFVQLDEFSQNSHSGTHMDAPAHFAKDGKLVGDIPLRDLAGPAVVIDIEQKARNNPEAQIEVSDLEDWESRNGPIPRGAIVLMHSGYGKYYGNQTRYFGYPSVELQLAGDTQHLHFPSFGGEAAKFLVEKRRIIGVGVDVPSLDIGQSRTFPAHIAFAEAGIWGLENVNNVDLLPESGYTMYAMVYWLKDNSGGPVRAYALPTSRENSVYNFIPTNAAPVGTSASLAILILGSWVVQRFFN